MKKIAIVGGGPAGLMAASQLLQSGAEVHIYDQKKTVGRKFLVAGEGGFNLTHSEEIEQFVERYDQAWIKECVRSYTNSDFRNFLASIGIETFIGSSGKVFPIEPIKPRDVLANWVDYLKNNAVVFHTNVRLTEWNETTLIFDDSGIEKSATFDYVVFALGGASWSKTGSDGNWKQLFEQKKLETLPFVSSNCGVVLADDWRYPLDGNILKNCVVTVGKTKCSGDIVCTVDGLEGKPIYAVNRSLRKNENPILTVDFKPQFSESELIKRLSAAATVSEGLKQLKLAKPAVFWLKSKVSKSDYLSHKALAKHIKAFEIPIIGFRPVEEAISVVGGLDFSEIKSNGELAKFTNCFVCGEMLNWDAPTGGYLIQACVSSGYKVGQSILTALTVEK